MKTKKYHTVGTVSKCNRKNIGYFKRTQDEIVINTRTYILRTK